jgi:hypothetical protein
MALANFYWGPLEFGPDGSILPVRCLDIVPVQLSVGQPGARVVRADSDQSTGAEGFHLRCDIGPTWRLQTFTAGRTGRLATVWFTTFTDGPADADLVLDIVRLGPGNLPADTLATSRVPASAVSWSAREIPFPIEGVEVVAGQRYGIRVHSDLRTGCYGFAYTDDSVYRRGQQHHSKSGGPTWQLEPGRALRFTTIVK